MSLTPVPVPDIAPGKEPRVQGLRITQEQLTALASAIEQRRPTHEWPALVADRTGVSGRRMDRALQWLRGRGVIHYAGHTRRRSGDSAGWQRTMQPADGTP